ncbi:AraC family transcriptional regulator [Paenibacillus sp. BIHB 4019]|uniref:AraC family transcriptional regulator n=1 Tax=Paenibacillus sp. BIHB 4019 TaxID=1870819 RepID=UPI001559A9C8|nr:AraC family transcriptional regulator [Paenibacillus sp. BIHB 4019]
MDIDGIKEPLEYYLILYKASLPLLTAPFIRKLADNKSPFHRQYEFAPHDPVVLLHLAKTMQQRWHETHSLQRIHVKALFYQFIYEVEQQLQMQGKQAIQPDLVEQVIRHIRECYSTPITLASIARLLNYSAPYVSKQFKNKTGYSLIDFLILTRVDKAKELLLHSEASLQEISSSVGYPDLSYFIRIFKKTTGVTPGSFKAQAGSSRQEADRPTLMLRLSDAARGFRRYIDMEHDNDYQYVEEGEFTMYKGTKTSMGATVLLCLALMLSACSSGSGAANSIASSTSPAASTQTQNNSPAASQTNAEPAPSVYTDSQGHEVQLPESPKRVVLQGNSIGDLLALGIQPIGVDRRFIDESVYLDKEQTKAQDIGFPTNFEALVDLAPDLTMLGYVLDKQYEEVSKISPTVVFDQSLPLAERLPIIGEIVGKQAEAKQLLADYDAKAENMWSELHKAGKLTEGETAVVLIYYWSKDMYLMKTGGLASLLYQQSGYQMSERVKELEPAAGSPYIEVSKELMHDMLIGDRLFILYPHNEDAEASFAELLETSLWKSLPAVKSGKVTFVETKWNYEDMLTSDMLLDELPKLLAQ